MLDAFGAGDGKPLANLSHQIERGFETRYALFQVVRQGVPAKQLHHEVEPAILLSDVEYGDDIPMAELRGYLRLA
jgi:hypothetical protein